MTTALTSQPQSEQLEKLDIETLWRTAERFGLVHIYASEPKMGDHFTAPIVIGQNYSCKIEFTTIPGVSLEAKSEYRLSLREALIGAITNARTIASQFRQSVGQLP